MGRYLIDRLVLLWWLKGDSHLGGGAKKIISDGRNQILVSTATLWELSRMMATGELSGIQDLVQLLQEENIEVLPINEHHAILAGDLQQEDLVRSLIASQVKAEGAVLITIDPTYGRTGIRTINALH